MNPTFNDLAIALIMVAVAVYLVVMFLRYKAGTSEQRMRGMLERCGLDPDLIATGDTRAIISEVRRLCRKCQNEAVCERWLTGEESGENSFCPNALTFEALIKNLPGSSLGSQNQ